MAMELRHLRYFVAVAEERSVTRAAERLWIAQPGLSTQIRRLEAELGVALLERHARGVELTTAGELFLERARAALAAADLASATGLDLRDGVAGTVRLGLTTSARWHQTSVVLDRFAREHAGVELAVLEGSGGTLWRDLREGRLDAMIAPSAYASADLNSLELGAEPWVLLVGENHRLAGTGPATVRDLQGERIAVAANRDEACHDRAVADLLGELEVTAMLVRAAPPPAMYRAVQHGDALTLTTTPDALPAGVLARPLEAARTVSFALLWRDETPSAALGELIRTATDSIQRDAAPRRQLAAVA
jgi:DNA-binding transcriptional LysR family regulator